jgi:hypothetical protein
MVMKVEDLRDMIVAYGQACANTDTEPRVSPSIFDLDAQDRLQKIDRCLVEISQGILKLEE